MATRKDKRKNKKRSVKNRIPTPYPKVHSAYVNVSETWINGQGRRNIVTIKNGKGHKRVERLGLRGEVLDTKNKPLTAPERAKILEGRFVPGLWRNCTVGQC